MSTGLFGYFNLGLRALSAAQMGLQISGNNISNISTPGFAKRRLELTSGLVLPVQGHALESGVEVAKIARIHDRFLQAGVEREKGFLAGSEELLRGLGQIESLFGTVDSDNLLELYATFSDRFTELAGQPENLTQRREAVSSADALARQVQNVYRRLQSQQRQENETVADVVGEVNQLATALAELNREIVAQESDGSVAAPLRDERDRVVERLSELTGGTAVDGGGGKLLFSLPGGPTLVTGDSAIELELTRDSRGFYEVRSGTFDFTGRIRDGKLGALLGLRDDQLQGRLADLDTVAADLITRTNALTTGAFDLDGNPGVALFEPDPPPATGAAGVIAVAAGVRSDPRLLAVSADGTPGDGSVAGAIAELRETASAALGDRSPAQFLGDVFSALGNEIVQTDVSTSVARGLLENLQGRRDALSGVSLDEEAVQLIQHQRAYQAAAQFIQVLNEVTETALSVGR